MIRAQLTLADAWRYRGRERVLFMLSFLSILAGYLLVLARKTGGFPTGWQAYLPLLVYLAAILVTHLALVLMRFRGDQLLLAAVFYLAGFGLLIQSRMGAYEEIDPGKIAAYAFPAGLALMLLVIILFRRGRYRALRPLALPCAALAALLLGAILVFGQRYRGAYFLPGNINPADIIKILLMIFLAGALARWQEKGVRAGPRELLPLLLGWAAPMTLLVLQRDLGMLALLNAVLLVMLAVASGRFSYLALGAAGTAILGAAVYFFSAHARVRLAAWLAPFADPTGTSWQVLQALSAMYAGGIWGVGLGGGSPQFIPIASSDFIYAVIGEELGYAGCGIVLAFFLVLIFRGYRVAGGLPVPFGRLLAAGIVTTLAFQVLLNIGGVMKALPLTGITLPFISHGGSSLLTTFLGFGLLLAISEREGETGKANMKPSPRRARRKAH